MRSTRQVAKPATPGDRAAGIVRAWVGCYTIGLRADIAIARKEMIEADLWDELREAEQLGVARSVGRQRMGRLFRGMPADLTWRLEQRRGSSGISRRNPMAISRLELVLLLGVSLLYGIGLVGGLMMIANPDPTRWESWGPYGLVAGLALSVVGLLVAIPRPSVGLALALAGTVLAMAAMPWAFYIFLPVPLVGWFRHARSRSAQVGSASLG
jgi:hypothetical protein